MSESGGQTGDAPDTRRWVEVWRGEGPAVKATADALHAAGIEVRIAGAGPSFHGDARLLVPEADRARARPFVPKPNPAKAIGRVLRTIFPFGPGRM